MNRVTTAPSSIASAAVNGIAGLIFPTRTGILARPNRVWASSHRTSLANDPLAIAQQSRREFLTKSPASVSVKACGVLALSVRATRKLSRVRESIGQRNYHTHNRL